MHIQFLTYSFYFHSIFSCYYFKAALIINNTCKKDEPKGPQRFRFFPSLTFCESNQPFLCDLLHHKVHASGNEIMVWFDIYMNAESSV